jgi:TonB family protein
MTNRTHVIRAVLCAAALLGAAPALHAQCTWEPGRPRGRREAHDDSVYKAAGKANRAAIRSALQAAGVSEPTGLVIVTTHRDGAPPVLRAFDVNFPTSALASALPAVVERLKELPARQNERVAAVVRLDTTALPPARADGRRRACEPRLLNRELVVNEVRRWATSAPDAERSTSAVMVGLALSRDGRVLYSEVSRSSGSQPLDQFALDLVRRLNFRPASLDGVNRDVWAVLPITVQ